MLRKTFGVCLVIGFDFLSLFGAAARGAVVEKANNATNLTTGSSWVGGAVPGSFDSAQWDSTLTGSNATSLGGNLPLGEVMILSPGGPVTISSPGTLALNGVGGTGVEHVRRNARPHARLSRRLGERADVERGGGQNVDGQRDHQRRLWADDHRQRHHALERKLRVHRRHHDPRRHAQDGQLRSQRQLDRRHAGGHPGPGRA